MACPDGGSGESLCNEGFKAFCKGIHPVTDPVARNTAASLTAISRTAGWDELLNVTWVLHVCNVTGRVLWQYSGIDWDVLDMVQEGGIVDYFGQEEVDRFVRGEYPRLNIGSKQIRQVCQLFGEDEWEAKHGTSEDQSVTH